MRFKYTMYNILSEYLPKLVIPVLGLLQLRYLNSTYGVDYVGLRTMILDFITFFYILYGGFGNTFAAQMYKASNENDEEKLKKVVTATKYVFNIIGILVILMTIGFMLVFPLFMKDTIFNTFTISSVLILLAMPNIAHTYVMPNSLFMLSKQKNYKIQYIRNIAHILSLVAFIVAAISKVDFIVAIAVYSVTKLSGEFITIYTARRLYPNILKAKPNKEFISKEVIHDAANMFASTVSIVIFNGADSFILKAIKGIGTVGIYGNYKYVSTAIITLITPILETTRGNLGNVFYTEDNEYASKFQKLLESLFLFVAVIVSFMVIISLSSFIMWVKADTTTVSTGVIVAYGMFLYLSVFFLLYKTQTEILGKFKESRNTAIITTIINLTVTLALVPSYGILGALAGTIAGYIFDFVRRKQIVYKTLEVEGYYRSTISNLVILFVISFVGYLFLSSSLYTTYFNFVSQSLVKWVIGTAAIGIVYSLGVFIAFMFNKDFRGFVIRVLNFFFGWITKKLKKN